MGASHVHAFPPESHTFDDTVKTWTKRCACGLTVEFAPSRDGRERDRQNQSRNSTALWINECSICTSRNNAVLGDVNVDGEDFTLLLGTRVRIHGVNSAKHSNVHECMAVCMHVCIHVHAQLNGTTGVIAGYAGRFRYSVAVGACVMWIDGYIQVT